MTLDIFCSLSGEHFSPKTLIERTGLVLESCIEVGEPHIWGKRLPSEYGIANLVAPKFSELDENDDPMNWIARSLLAQHAVMLECGVEEFKLWVIIYYEGILNWWVSVENMKIFSDLNIVLCLTAYKQEEQPNAELPNEAQIEKIVP